jgi:hypothetical protein
MSARSISDEIIFSSKEMTRPAISKIGHTGWVRKTDGSLEEVVYANIPWLKREEWINMEIYRTKMADVRNINRERERLFPYLRIRSPRNRDDYMHLI